LRVLFGLANGIEFLDFVSIFRHKIKKETHMTDTSLPTTSSTPQFKSIFQSKTFWGAVLTAVTAIAPAIARDVTKYQDTHKFDPQSISEIVVILATTGLTLMGRIDANSSAPVYTPNWAPGPNKPETKSSESIPSPNS
jgi:hypothetical protein